MNIPKPLLLTVRHRVVSADLPDSLQRFRENEAYLLGSGGDSIRLDDFRFYIQNTALQLSDGTELQVADRLEVFSPTDGALVIVDDVVRVDPTEFGILTLGGLLPTGTVTGVRFEVGLPESWGLVNPTEYPADHPLRVGANEITYDSLDGYSSLAAAYRIPPSAPDSTVVRFLGALPVTLPLIEPVTLRRGFDISIEVRLNYHQLFESIDIASAIPSDLTGAIVDQLPNSFEIFSVSQE